jgi:hypothetical protein
VFREQGVESHLCYGPSARNSSGQVIGQRIEVITITASKCSNLLNAFDNYFDGRLASRRIHYRLIQDPIGSLI